MLMKFVIAPASLCSIHVSARKQEIHLAEYIFLKISEILSFFLLY